MSQKPISPLRRRMIEDMSVRKFGEKTQHAFAAHLAPLKRTRWFVYAKRPFAGPKAVLAYLSRMR